MSTPPGYGGLGIVRLSGRKSLSISKRIFRPRRKCWRDISARTSILGDIFDSEKKEFIDEAFLAYFPAPRSYTRENVVEISCHGSPVILEEVVRLGIRAGARPAHPGEFTLRAYLGGRMDIIQAEAVNDLITAASLHQAKISLGQLRGGLSRRIELLRSQVVDLISLLEASIEFPEEGLGIPPGEAASRLEKILQAINALIASYETGRAMTEGLNLAIVGRANVGKSTLFNALLDHERAIVSPYPGTTRDYLRERIKIKGSFFHLIDMAGLERPSHPVEKDGIRRSRELASRADGILFVLDASRNESQADLGLIEKFKKKRMILVFNKADLPGRIDRSKCRAVIPTSRSIGVSALKGTNIARLKNAIWETFSAGESIHEDVILHMRQKTLFEQVSFALEDGLKRLREGHPEEICAEEVRRALPFIGQLTGEIRVDEVMTNIFSRFCVGK
ncbi:MAG: tRNA uridine-5-carboxymethylaminomethyl(34) synthesis GTPase MnmE [Candidatus Aminicenantes bacterium]|nr:tRNA uridine-5-carboxymethylaminomethyl(34) synthesis GTPase MnmE [Candidatus Aminicenantes bacterium]